MFDMAGKKIKALITGYGGFVGSFLARELLQNGRKVYGAVFAGLNELSPLHKPLEKKVVRHPLQLLDYDNVKKVIDEIRPDEVYHLAGISHVPTSWKNPRLTYSVNVSGSLNLLDALRQSGKDVKILVITSAEVYGSPDQDKLPTVEDQPLLPESPYAASKASLDLLSMQWSRFPRMHVVRARPFSHTGPGQTPAFVCPAFAKQIAAISLGIEKPEMKIGDLSAKRDFSDVRDVVRAYRLMLDKAENGEVFNVCSGKSRTISGILRTLKSFSKVKIKVETDPERLRPSDIPETRGSHKKLTLATGWKPEIKFSDTLREIYDYWIKTLK
jgi:GDP-4-dehydro-6-deoxy-D-mannose reductase